MKAMLLVFLLILIPITPFSYAQTEKGRHNRTRGRHGRNSQRPPKEPKEVGAKPPSKGRGTAYQDQYQVVSREIHLARPLVTAKALSCDQTVLRAALPKVRKAHQKSDLSIMDTEQALLTAWKNVRLSPEMSPDQCMNLSAFAAYTLSLGRLIFKSIPEKATITVDGEDLHAPTTHSGWFEKGAHKVRFRMEGRVPVEKTCVVEESKQVECSAELRP